MERVVKSRVKYPANALKSAIFSIKNGAKIADAARIYGIPRQTLSYKSRINQDVILKPGPKPVLSKSNEDILVTWILDGAIKGDPKNMTQIKNGAWLLASNQDAEIFGPLGPSNGWIKGFFKRYPILSSRTPDKLSKASMCITKNNLLSWFDDIKDWLTSKGLDYLLLEPGRIFNADESGFLLTPEGLKVFVRKGQRHVNVASNCSKEQMTVMYCICADGSVLDPFIIYPGKRLNAEIKCRIPDNVNYTMSANGWMNEEAFMDWLRDFDRQLTEKNVQRPVILTVDGHTSHESLNVSLLCKELDIVLIRMYPNATSFYQPCDRGLFKPLKSLYKRYCDFNGTFNDKSLDKKGFAEILGRIHREINSDWITEAFRTCGIYPWNGEAINFERLNINTGPEVVEGDANITNNSASPNGSAEGSNETDDNIQNVAFDDVSSNPAQVLVSNDLNNNEDVNAFEPDFRTYDDILRQYDTLNDFYPEPVATSSSENINVDNEHTVVTNIIIDNELLNEEAPDVSVDLNATITRPTSFQRAKEFYSSDSIYQKHIRILGPDTVNEFNDPHFEQNIEFKKKAYETHMMLKTYEEQRLTPLSLPVHETPKRKGRIAQKRPFVSVSDEYIEIMQQKKQKKIDEEEAKEQRKKVREEKKAAKENLVKIKAERNATNVAKRGRPKKNILKPKND